MADAQAPRKLTIVQVCTGDIGGGAPKVAYSLHQIYRQQGHDSFLVVGRKHSADPAVLAVDNSDRKRSWGHLKMVLGLLLGWQDIHHPGSHRIPALVGRKWDVLHLHNLHGSYFDLAALPALSRLAPTVLMMHDNWLQTGHCAYHMACGRWRTGCGSCPDLSIPRAIRRDGTRFNWRRKQRLIRQSRLWITAPSQWLLDEARDSLLANKPMRLVRNGVDLQVYVPGSREQARTELELPQGIPLVVFSATSALVNPFKDGRTTLAALRQLVNCLPQVRLVALGGTTVPPGFESVAGSIIARPFEADPRKVAAYYRAGDVFAHASRADNAPLSIIEAMACGLPVVASAVGGIPEYVEHDKTGLLVPPEDAEALAAAFRRMLEDQELRARLAQEALTVAKQRYDIQDQARSYLAWYTELIRETSSDMGRDR